MVRVAAGSTTSTPKKQNDVYNFIFFSALVLIPPSPPPKGGEERKKAPHRVMTRILKTRGQRSLLVRDDDLALGDAGLFTFKLRATTQDTRSGRGAREGGVRTVRSQRQATELGGFTT